MEEFEKYSIVKNTISKKIGVVLKSAGGNITVEFENGDVITFKKEYLVPASGEEAEKAKLLIERVAAKEKSKAKPARNPALIVENLKKYFRHIRVRYPKSADELESLWTEIMKISKDIPGKTWDMKSGSNPCPILKVFNLNTRKWVYFMALQGGWGLRIEVKKEYLPEEFSDLFPIDNAMFGAGKAIEINFFSFSPGKKRRLLDCVEKIYKNHPNPE